MGHKFEVFSGGCELCKIAIETLKNNISKDDEIIEYSLLSPIQEKVYEKVKKYEINVVPSIIVNEKHKYTGVLKPAEIKNIIEEI